ncbi:hypothetical protein BLNAU_737 [Blattamonas nauphoetae]|uniref:Uncharacterized protein n=1 Tax=Blattamonas nauphoetae TaxID=2049346 RepID=A0ABQ9YKL7_9EUKA|nr:hypothetical protein BLNAU_737 [Blattamonas nauphoetae]
MSPIWFTNQLNFKKIFNVREKDRDVFVNLIGNNNFRDCDSEEEWSVCEKEVSWTMDGTQKTRKIGI